MKNKQKGAKTMFVLRPLKIQEIKDERN